MSGIQMITLHSIATFLTLIFFQHQDDQGSQDPNVDVQSLLPGAFDSGKPRGALSVLT